MLQEKAENQRMRQKFFRYIRKTLSKKEILSTDFMKRKEETGRKKAAYVEKKTI